MGAWIALMIVGIVLMLGAALALFVYYKMKENEWKAKEEEWKRKEEEWKKREAELTKKAGA